MNGLNYFDVDDEGDNYKFVDSGASSVTGESKASVRKRIHLRTLPYDKGAPIEHGEFDDVEKMGDGRGYFWEKDYYQGYSGAH